jgi:hypothetical protein
MSSACVTIGDAAWPVPQDSPPSPLLVINAMLATDGYSLRLLMRWLIA